MSTCTVYLGAGLAGILDKSWQHTYDTASPTHWHRLHIPLQQTSKWQSRLRACWLDGNQKHNDSLVSFWDSVAVFKDACFSPAMTISIRSLARHHICIPPHQASIHRHRRSSGSPAEYDLYPINRVRTSETVLEMEQAECLSACQPLTNPDRFVSEWSVGGPRR